MKYHLFAAPGSHANQMSSALERYRIMHRHSGNAAHNTDAPASTREAHKSSRSFDVLLIVLLSAIAYIALADWHFLLPETEHAHWQHAIPGYTVDVFNALFNRH